MIFVLLADTYGSKLWPLTSEELPQWILPIYGSRTPFDDVFSRVPDQTTEKDIYILTTTAIAKSLKATDLLKKYELPEKCLIKMPSYHSSLLSMQFALSYIHKLNPDLPDDEVITFIPLDQFFWPLHTFIFHILNNIEYAKANPTKLVCAALQPAGPSPFVNYIKTDWGSAVQMGMPLEEEDSEEDSTITLGMPALEYAEKTDTVQALKLVEANWLWDLSTYTATFGFFNRLFLTLDSPFCSGDTIKVLRSLFKGNFWQWKQQIFRNRTKKMWDTLTPIDFNLDVFPTLIKEKKVIVSLFSRILWSSVQDWVSVKQLLVETGLIYDLPQENLHKINSINNLVFKPYDKQITLVGVKDLIIIDADDKLLIATPEALHANF